MPELPEVENVRLALLPRLVGRRVVEARLRRADVLRVGGVRGGGGGGGAGARSAQRTLQGQALLAGQRIVDIQRLGKQLALIDDGGACVCVHLGMSGSLRFEAGGTRPPAAVDGHAHVVWRLAGSGGAGDQPGGRGGGGGWVIFRDPRRFGGVWAYPSLAALEAERWARLGPDALAVTPGPLHRRLQGTRRAVKAALLDQGVVAGLGNIYVDELLHGCGLSPTRVAATLGRDEVTRLVRRMRALLTRAIAAGGSTFRDYVNGDGETGRYQGQHRVYGRAGEACRGCRSSLATAVVAGRTTVWCRRCQG
ncbi:MAG: DNA-formamidopyrimidine glycosylase family protein [Phycisphaeraceae bacterium]